MLRVIVILLAGLSALSAVGCGGSGGASTSTKPFDPKAPEHVAFLKQVNPICEDYNKTVKEVQSELKQRASLVQDSTDLSPYVKPLSKSSAAARQAAARFRALKPPADEEKQAALIAGTLKALSRGNGLLLQAAQKDDDIKFRAASTALQEIQPKLQALMRAYGMTVCGAPK